MATRAIESPELTGFGQAKGGYYVLENSKGETVRTFSWEASAIIVIYRHDNRRVETVASVAPLKEQGVSFEILAETTRSKVKKTPLELASGGRLRWVQQIPKFAPNHHLRFEAQLEPRQAALWSLGLQLGILGLMLAAGYFSGAKSMVAAPSAEVTLLNQDAINKILEAQKPEHLTPAQPINRPASKPEKKVVYAPTEHKVEHKVPNQMPTHSTQQHKVRVATGQPRGGGFAGTGKRGYGTNEEHMNEIGALGALNSPRVKGGNGGRGGLNLQAVGTEEGSGAGGHGHGGFGSNGGGGHGLGGLGSGHGSGIAHALYGQGLIAAPQGDGSPAPGVGGYGTRGKAGGGARGAGYGTQTVVGSWKGTGPKGSGPAGSGSGNGEAYGSPYGSADGDDDEVITGGLSMDQIQQIVERNIGQVRYCYEQALQKEPRLAGRVAVRFQIAGSGRVTLAQVKHSSVHSAQVENCIVGKLKTWSFPKPQGGVTVGVVYPFVLNRTVSMR